jgi:glycerol-3-phosphate acyltransferase PlsY
MSPPLEFATLIAAYLLGAMPFSYWVGLGRGVDVRAAGSGNVGATNVMRTAGHAAGLLAFVLDVSKGAAAGALAHWLDPRGWLGPAAAACAVVGHMYPIWLRFRGGKGVATAFGAFIMLAPEAAILGLIAFVLTLTVTRYVSVASIVAAVVLALLTPVCGASHWTSVGVAVVATLVVLKHHANLGRLASGAEPRVRRWAIPRGGAGR